ncbi:MAG: AMP-dependent synthetase and ligase, partial [Candidatus Acidoferrum typicum]|nr:AMP-dependent synthetase and ligase [Candidatus Acidoferrum typicum]
MGLGSLERVELLLRIEQAFGARLDDRVLAEADTVQDLISALSAADGSLVSEPRRSVAARVPEILSNGIAEGLPTAETFQNVLRYRGRVDTAKTHLIFFEDEGESPALTFGEL